MKFMVMMQKKIRDWVIVEADTPEEAVGKAVKAKGKVSGLTVELDPVAVSEPFTDEEPEELPHDVTGQCEKCRVWITERDIPGQPWNYTSDPDSDGVICYACAIKEGIHEVP